MTSIDMRGRGYTTTDQDGAYQVAVPAGQYRVSLLLPDVYLTQYAHRKIAVGDAQTFPMVTGQNTVVDEQLLPTGSMSGQFTDASGQPVEGENVTVSPAWNGSSLAWATTDTNGEYRIPALFVGDYKVEFDSPDGTAQRYAAGKKTFEPVPRHAGDGHGWLGDRVQPGAD